MNKTYIIRKYQAGDETQILDLRDLVFHPKGDRGGSREHWLDWWWWMYMDNPAGKAIIWLAVDKGNVVGHYGSIPIRVKIGEQIVLCGMSVDSMIHPDYQRQGIFIALARKAYEEAFNRGIHILYGLPNKAAFNARTKKLNWVDAGLQKDLLKVINLEHLLYGYVRNKSLIKPCALMANPITNLLFRAKRIPATDGFKITKILSFDERIEGFWYKISRQPNIMVVRDKRFLDWKYCEVPNLEYSILLAEQDTQILGYIVFRCIKRRGIKIGIIYDVVAVDDNPKIIQRLVFDSVNQLKQKKADIVMGRMLANKAYIDCFRENGFIGLWFFMKSRFHVYSNHPAVHVTDINKPERWFLQIGDTQDLTGPLDPVQ
jgi:GNAT superfamily N-acetyltransferase